jgi:hypothetical protein
MSNQQRIGVCQLGGSSISRGTSACRGSFFSVVLAAGLLLGGLCNAALAQDRYTFKSQLRSGDTVQFDITSHDASDWTQHGGDNAGETKSNEIYHDIGTLQFLDVKDGVAKACKVTFDPKCTVEKIGSNGSHHRQPADWAGMTITVWRSAAGNVTNDSNLDLDSDQTNFLEGMIAPDCEYFPDHPIAVGDVFDVSDQLRPDAHMSDGDKMLTECRLDAVRTGADGHRLADLSINSAYVFAPEEDFLQSVCTVTGTATVDLDCGEIVAGKFKSHTDISPDPNATQPTTAPATADDQYTTGTDRFDQNASATAYVHGK